MDLSTQLGKAVQAAKRGDVDVLEVELSKLRGMPAESVSTVRSRLRAKARSVRSHPSFTPLEAAQAS